ncbi:MAG: chemotaxis response regulator protein-glutamate methylesterase [Vampirovibrionales bacterium]|nr:chemotaxis response regulator protein-glutamate methylesterase [Vampirovibrionales bacterium]
MTAASPVLNLLIADDSLTYRMIMKQAVQGLEGVNLLGTAVNGLQAVEMLAEKPADLVLMDVEMPVMDGLTALSEIKAKYPEVKVVLVSGINRSAADMTIEALQRGALDFIPKPNRETPAENLAEIKERLSVMVAIVRSKLAKPGHQALNSPAPASQSPSAWPANGIAFSGAKTPASPAAQKPSLIKPEQPPRIRAIAIGSSTGGPNALSQVIPNLPGNLGVPVFLVQHMPPVFTASLAKSLNEKSALTVKEAEAGEHIKPNTVYIAPGGYHMTVSKNGVMYVIGLDQNPAENSCRPAVDPLYRSVAEHYGKNVLAVVMTGMGSDGAKGLYPLKKAGAYALTQDEASCVVYGMPKAAVDAGLSDEQLPLDAIANRIAAITLQSNALQAAAKL